MTAPATIPPRAPSARPMASKPVATPRAVPIPIPTISHTPAKRSCKAFISLPSGQGPAVADDIDMISLHYRMSSRKHAKTLNHRGHGEHRDLEASSSVSFWLSVVQDKP